MGELHEATIEWVGDTDAASLFIAAAQAFDCETNCVHIIAERISFSTNCKSQIK